MAKPYTSSERSYLDLVFESKNKAYGAYTLRKKSPVYTAIGFLISSLLILGAFVVFWIINRPEPLIETDGTIKMQHRKVIGYSQLDAPPPIEVAPPPEVAPTTPKIVKHRKIASKKFLPPIVKPDEEVVDEEIIPTQEELKLVNPGKKTEEGDTLGAVDLKEYEEAIIEIDIDPTNTIKEEKKEKPAPVVEEVLPPPPPPPKKKQVYDIVEIPPKFPGGEEALIRFVGENLEYPQIARENGIQGTVVLKLIIEADGSISDVLVLRGLGGGCEKEAIRVVHSMPKWEPGIQNGKKVRVGVALPIRFKLIQEQ